MPKGTRYKRHDHDTAVSSNRVAWVDTFLGTVAAHIVPEHLRTKPTGSFVKVEPGDNVYLEIPTGAGFSHMLALTSLTEQELLYLEEVAAEAIAAAKPICKERDDYAAAADESADRSESLHQRNYRPIPRLFRRPRAQ